VIFQDGRLSFDALQRRLVTAPAKARRLVATVPASFVAFDLLAIGGVDLRTQRWTTRRARLEKLAERWQLPLQVSPVTASRAEAQEWFDVLPEAMGIEGLGKRRELPVQRWPAGVAEGEFCRGRGVRRAHWWAYDQVSDGSRGARLWATPVGHAADQRLLSRREAQLWVVAMAASSGVEARGRRCRDSQCAPRNRYASVLGRSSMAEVPAGSLQQTASSVR
jgi:hypothetical protein